MESDAVSDKKQEVFTFFCTQVDAVRAFLLSTQCPEHQVDAVLNIVANIGFKTELGGAAMDLTPEFAIVQDADRLDAIGAIGLVHTTHTTHTTTLVSSGIARCLTFGGARKRFSQFQWFLC